MTLIYPEGISTIGNLGLQLMPAVAAPQTKITLAEWNAGDAIQMSIRNIGVNGEQNTFEDIRLGTVDIMEGLGRNRISIDPLQVVYDPQKPTDTNEYKIQTLLMAASGGGSIYLGQRAGIDQYDAAAATQIVSYLYLVKVGVPNEVPVDNTDDGNIFMRQFKLAFQRRWVDVALAAS